MPPSRTTIPLCRSPLLQDVTIALGRRSLKSLRKSHPTLKFQVRKEETDGTLYERLDIEARSLLGQLTKIAIWEDGMSWVYSKTRSGKASPQLTFETHANLLGMNADVIAQLLRDSLCDLKSVESVWEQRACKS